LVTLCAICTLTASSLDSRPSISPWTQGL
jgi:hypothetical protein